MWWLVLVSHRCRVGFGVGVFFLGAYRAHEEREGDGLLCARHGVSIGRGGRETMRRWRVFWLLLGSASVNWTCGIRMFFCYCGGAVTGLGRDVQNVGCSRQWEVVDVAVDGLRGQVTFWNALGCSAARSAADDSDSGVKVAGLGLSRSCAQQTRGDSRPFELQNRS